MNEPFFSIVIPVYNVERYLPMSIESALNQDYDKYEVILVDDGSSDGSAAICDLYAKADSRVKVIHRQNRGQGEARNTGMDASRGEYIYFIDSDDTIQPDTLSTFVAFLNRHGDFSMVGTEFQYVEENDRMAPAADEGEDEIFDDIKEAQNSFLKRRLIFLAPATFYNAKWLVENKLRFKKVPYSEDQLFVWVALEKAERIGFIHKVTYNYYLHPGSIMTSTKFEKIMMAYPYFKELQREFDADGKMDAETRRFMLTRWTVGIFRSAAKLCSYSDYKELLKRCEAELHIKNARQFPDLKIRMLAILYGVSLKLFYMINKLTK